jgi:hypothetical protein
LCVSQRHRRLLVQSKERALCANSRGHRHLFPSTHLRSARPNRNLSPILPPTSPRCQMVPLPMQVHQGTYITETPLHNAAETYRHRCGRCAPIHLFSPPSNNCSKNMPSKRHYYWVVITVIYRFFRNVCLGTHLFDTGIFSWRWKDTL